MSSPQDFCREWVRLGRYGDINNEGNEDITFEQCLEADPQNQGGANSSQRHIPNKGIFSSWWTLIFIVLALLIPLAIVAVYTNFTFKWQKKESKQPT